MNGGLLSKIKTINTKYVNPKAYKAKFVVACDVENKLLGKEGSVRVFGP